MFARLILLLLFAWSAGAMAEQPFPASADAGNIRLCLLYEERSQQRWGRFNLALRPLGKDAARWQIELWQDLVFIRQVCPALAERWSTEQLCLLGRHLLGPQRGYLASQSWRRSQTGEEATLVLELGDQVDQVCGAPVMAVQSVLQHLQGIPGVTLPVHQPDGLVFNSQVWFSSFGAKGSSASTKK